uniref:Uncharacterized protein n=1 Tax=Chromera velia CCMP2878 TaxID=1169474 RepID=A0A0G4I4Q9_9ALVE|eukprot:Cvel_10979.t1-p1 / transcript=Cvel_10979.t1 / gene=Cvel_10979 / organism=Chromera_velia_CCMP2878 / gene_product=hypothetical protein / transcript_product=hypothetical protein / location=Cvel_scaffold675:59974-60953(+) / protein_length=307 / sequence_SO=supercontig / SO=protein_coding / is_pseudo=false
MVSALALSRLLDLSSPSSGAIVGGDGEREETGTGTGEEGPPQAPPGHQRLRVCVDFGVMTKSVSASQILNLQAGRLLEHLSTLSRSEGEGEGGSGGGVEDKEELLNVQVLPSLEEEERRALWEKVNWEEVEKQLGHPFVRPTVEEFFGGGAGRPRLLTLVRDVPYQSRPKLPGGEMTRGGESGHRTPDTAGGGRDRTRRCLFGRGRARGGNGANALFFVRGNRVESRGSEEEEEEGGGSHEDDFLFRASAADKQLGEGEAGEEKEFQGAGGLEADAEEETKAEDGEKLKADLWMLFRDTETVNKSHN